MALCYTSNPEQLSRRFPHLESVKLKGKPRPAMFNLIPEDWGGYVTPWVVEITKSFSILKALHFRRMLVRDSDLELLANRQEKFLQVLKLDKYSGFSIDGLLHISRSCRNLLISLSDVLLNGSFQLRNGCSSCLWFSPSTQCKAISCSRSSIK